MIFDGETVVRCPKRPFLEDGPSLATIFWYYGRYKSGILPEAGGLEDQCGKMMMQFRVIDAAMDEYEDHRRKEQERETARATSGGAKSGGRIRPRPARRSH